MTRFLGLIWAVGILLFGALLNEAAATCSQLTLLNPSHSSFTVSGGTYTSDQLAFGSTLGDGAGDNLFDGSRKIDENLIDANSNFTCIFGTGIAASGSANMFFATPSGGSGAGGMRAITAADISSVSVLSSLVTSPGLTGILLGTGTTALTTAASTDIAGAFFCTGPGILSPQTPGADALNADGSCGSPFVYDVRDAGVICNLYDKTTDQGPALQTLIKYLETQFTNTPSGKVIYVPANCDVQTLTPIYVYNPGYIQFIGASSYSSGITYYPQSNNTAAITFSAQLGPATVTAFNTSTTTAPLITILNSSAAPYPTTPNPFIVGSRIQLTGTFTGLTFSGGGSTEATPWTVSSISGSAPNYKATLTGTVAGQAVSGTFTAGGGGTVTQTNEIVGLGMRNMFLNTGTQTAGPCASGACSTTGIKAQDNSTLVLDRISVDMSEAGSYINNSIGLWLQGREGIQVSNAFFGASTAILVDSNPDNLITFDQSNFHSVTLGGPKTADPSGFTGAGPYTLPHTALIAVAPGSSLTNITFTGSQSWIGGYYGLYWNSTSVPPGVSYGIAFDNLRLEQGYGGTLGAGSGQNEAFYINPTSGSGNILQSLSVRNLALPCGTNLGYFRNFGTINIVNAGGCGVSANTNTILDFDGGSEMHMEGFTFGGGNGGTLLMNAGGVPVNASGMPSTASNWRPGAVAYTAGSALPNDAVYLYSLYNTYAGVPINDMGVSHWATKGVFTSSAAATNYTAGAYSTRIPCDSGNYGAICKISISVSDGANLAESATYIVSPFSQSQSGNTDAGVRLVTQGGASEAPYQSFTLSGVTTGTNTVVTTSSSSTCNPFVVGEQMNVYGGGVTYTNGSTGIVTAIGGSSGAWTATLAGMPSSGTYTSGGTISLYDQPGPNSFVNSSGSYAYPATGHFACMVAGAGVQCVNNSGFPASTGPYTVSAITAGASPTVTITATGSNPISASQYVNFYGACGMTLTPTAAAQSTSQGGLIVPQAASPGGSSGAFTFTLPNMSSAGTFASGCTIYPTTAPVQYLVTADFYRTQAN